MKKTLNNLIHNTYENTALCEYMVHNTYENTALCEYMVHNTFENIALYEDMVHNIDETQHSVKTWCIKAMKHKVWRSS